MRAEEQFDSFYLKTRRALVHQTFALTGDLGAAQRAVRDAYVVAWHHWRKVSRYEDPRDWVRPRAWLLAQRRHTARLWHRTRSISPDDRVVLDALHKLPVSERRAWLLVELAGVPPEVAAREANAPQQTVDLHSRLGTTRLTAALGGDAASVRARVLGLADAASSAALPRPSVIRREGRRRRRTHTAVAVATATFVAVGSGAFAHQPPVTAPETEAGAGTTVEQAPSTTEVEQDDEPTLPSADDLLEVGDVAKLAPSSRWKAGDTHDNTSGDGINTVCQQERFADPDGLAALVRTFTARGPSERSVVQTMEVSQSENQARAAFKTAAAWYSGCRGKSVHLERTHRVRGIGDRAMLFDLRGWHSPRPEYTVAVAQLGQVVTSAVVTTTRGPAPSTTRVERTLATAARQICERIDTADCVSEPASRVVAPAPSGEEPGILATVDLPGLRDIRRPWAGTSPAPGRPNPAATSCDRAAFGPAGAQRTRTRTFLVPGARLPDRFGLTETYGSFRRPRAAVSFLRTVRERVARCEDRDLATEVLAPENIRRADMEGTAWRLRTELSEDRDVVFDVGFVRRGRHVAQVTFVPAGRADVRPGDFRALLVRAGQRLGELD